MLILATPIALRSATAFRNTCFTVFDKMINTVPAAVTLSDPVVVRPWTMLESQLDLTSTGTVNFTGKIAAHGTPAPPSFATYQYGTTGGGNTGSRTSQVGGKCFPCLSRSGCWNLTFSSRATWFHFWWWSTSSYRFALYRSGRHQTLPVLGFALRACKFS
jgi:hypothetical protein